MNIAELSIRKSVITWVMTILMVVAGWVSFNGLSRLEDPEFTIKQAAIITPYPGASAAEVEEEVTNVIEKACQQLGQLWWIESRSSPRPVHRLHLHQGQVRQGRCCPRSGTNCGARWATPSGSCPRGRPVHRQRRLR